MYKLVRVLLKSNYAGEKHQIKFEDGVIELRNLHLA